ncbi:MAG: CRISPR-associated helicase Cas3' [Chloroflexota bacterium]|nr:MAG: CRISPR-associated helicase Cas3' [Chloroflexota bacterium]
MGERLERKIERLDELEFLLLQHPEGLTKAEIARRLQVHRSTAAEYIDDLGKRVVLYEPSEGKYVIDREAYKVRVQLTLHESLAVHLAARLLTTRTDKHNPHAASALRKLGVALEKLAPRISQHLALSADVLDDSSRRRDPVFLQVLETLTRAWSLGKKVHLTHEMDEGKIFEYDFAPYFIEPYAVGRTLHVIGLREPPGKVRTFKVENIRTANLLENSAYEIPPEFDPRATLKDAWGIWYTERKPEPVVLRFARQVAPRVRQTQWHHTERTQEEPDGSLLWRAEIAEWQEMVPWVRGWGADVEVMEPEGLRETLKQEMKQLVKIYGLTDLATPTNQLPAYRLMWAKAERGKIALDVHRLIYHLIDVGQVVLALWERVFNEGLKRELAEWLALTVEETGRLIAFWASLHDLGKASPAFQDHPSLQRTSPRLHQQILRELTAAQMQFPARSGGETRARHEAISTWALNDTKLLMQYSTLPPALAVFVAQSLSGHHGAWHPTITVNDADAFSDSHLKPEAKAKDAWHIARSELVREMVTIFRPPAITAWNTDTTRDNKMLTLVSAIVSVADWLGSDDENFPYEERVLPLDSYTRHSKQHALLALLRAEWQSAPAMPRLEFERAFGFEPSRAQQQVSAALKNAPLPALAILEAPMGSGKTEAALAVYADWAKLNDSSGLYIAMPTTATSNQMYTRVTDFLGKQFGANIDTMLVHSQALLRDVPEEHDVIEEPDKEGDQAAQQSWFLPRKKSLLFPFGVGTVDQALMSVLQTKHFFVRLLGLHHKVVIFDEVHAYDAYMSELFERLLIWLRQLNVSVIVLSATLPENTRFRLLRTYANNSANPPEVKYPRLTFAAADGKVGALELERPASKALRFEWLAQDDETIIQQLRAELREGGCAVVIRNTIGRAQGLYLTLSNLEEKLCDDENLILFHARFPFAWREELEKKVLEKFGPGKDKHKPNPHRPHKAIVIATQVVEQSLDLDFDVMISDHAPIDLLLQRAGRLQRHSVNDATRTHTYRLQIAAPEIKEGIPQFERADTWIYDEYVLLRSWLALNKITTHEIQLPNDIPKLVEEVYGETELSAEPRVEKKLAETKTKMSAKEVEAEDLAEERMIREPSFRRLLYAPSMQLEEDDYRVHKAFRALTRVDPPGLQVVCLHRKEGKLFLDMDDPETIYDLSAKLEKRMIRELARQTVNVRHRDPSVEQALLSDLDDPQIKAILLRWKKVSALRYHRVVIFEHDFCVLRGTNYIMRLGKADKLGLQIYKEGE